MINYIKIIIDCTLSLQIVKRVLNTSCYAHSIKKQVLCMIPVINKAQKDTNSLVLFQFVYIISYITFVITLQTDMHLQCMYLHSLCCHIHMHVLYMYVLQ